MFRYSGDWGYLLQLKLQRHPTQQQNCRHLLLPSVSTEAASGTAVTNLFSGLRRYGEAMRWFYGQVVYIYGCSKRVPCETALWSKGTRFCCAGRTITLTHRPALWYSRNSDSSEVSQLHGEGLGTSSPWLFFIFRCLDSVTSQQDQVQAMFYRVSECITRSISTLRTHLGTLIPGIGLLERRGGFFFWVRAEIQQRYHSRLPHSFPSRTLCF